MSDPKTGPQGFRWRLAGASLPPLTAALRIGDAARAAVYRVAEGRGLLQLPDAFHNGSGQNHSHAFWLAEDADQDGFIDHVVLFAAVGLPPALIPALAEGGTIRLAGLGRWRMEPDWMGRRAPGALFGPARCWVSATAYVTPLSRHAETGKGGHARLAAEEQLRWEIGMRRLGAKLAELALMPNIARGGAIFPARDFLLKARRRPPELRGKPLPSHWNPPTDAERVGARLLFHAPVWGPLAFGFGAHFGLGLFEPVDELGLLEEE
jgi:CRISPR-associated protein Csb2